MSSDKKLLVIEHGVKLSGDAYRKLEEAGYVVVRGDPALFHTFPSDPTLFGERTLLECALRAFKEQPDSNATIAFKRLLMNRAIEDAENANAHAQRQTTPVHAPPPRRADD